MTAVLTKPLSRIVVMRGREFVVQLTPDAKLHVRAPRTPAKRSAVFDLERLVAQYAKSLFERRALEASAEQGS